MCKFHFAIIIAVVGVLSSCSRSIIQEKPAVQNGIIAVTLPVCSSEQQIISRSTDESTIEDVNVYLFGRTNGQKIHIYTRSSNVDFECLPGEYDLYVMVNAHKDMGEKTIVELRDYKISWLDSQDDLPMSAHEFLTIPVNKSGAVVLPAIQVRRNVAKIAYNVKVDAVVSDINLASVQIMNIPSRTFPMRGLSVPSKNREDYRNGPLTAIPITNGGAFSGVSYLFENMQGNMSSITDQRQKNQENAPKYATYLLIRATRGSKVLAYSIYLGENNTSDFNVRPNCCYTLNITILNDNTVDTRIAAYTATVYDNLNEKEYGNYCVYDVDRGLYVDILNDNSTLAIDGDFEVISGESESLEFDRMGYGGEHDFKIYNLKGRNYFEINYCPPFFTKSNSTLAYRITLTDEYGFAQEYNLRHVFANVVYAYTGTGGNITSDKCLYIATTTENGTSKTTVLCHEDGCRLTATATNGNVFEGWYADAGYTRLLSSSATYTFVPNGPYANIYTKFRSMGTPLDSKGTANCYIAPSLNTLYSFDATTMGNGAWTKNIIPRKLSGTNAKVIWETGTVRGAVIKNIFFESGRIYFETGATQGNALIGLFNNNGECLWSWHIWATDYDPAAKAQNYASGAAFMDRNLGALITNYTQLSSRGLYYQWGRKDPFIYPGTMNTYIGTAPVVYSSGFSYSINYPANNEPADEMTVNWSIQHPTTYMEGAYYSEWDDKNDILDWLYTPNQNLWGNSSTNTLINSNSSKSIYDPCPPGWRVPELEKFKGITYQIRSTPYLVIVNYNGTMTTYYPLGDSFNGTGFLNNGESARIYTCSPYSWVGSSLAISTYNCGSLTFRTSISGTTYYRYEACPVRCIKE